MEDDLLAQELGKIGVLGGKIGGALSGAGKFPDASASLAVEVVAKFLPTETCTQQISLPVPADKALKLGFFVLSKQGKMHPVAP
nr:hypothetical protein [Desulfobacula sp.]